MMFNLQWLISIALLKFQRAPIKTQEKLLPRNKPHPKPPFSENFSQRNQTGRQLKERKKQQEAKSPAAHLRFRKVFPPVARLIARLK